MDWLTTLIIGLGLVNLKQVFDYFTAFCLWAAAAMIGVDDAPPRGLAVVAGCIGVSYLTSGFFVVYLWAQRFMPKEMLDAANSGQEMAQLKAEVDAARTQTRELRIAVDRSQSIAISAAEHSLPGDHAPNAAEQAYSLQELMQTHIPGVSDADLQDLRSRYGKAQAYADEPLRGYGPSSAAGYSLSARVEERVPASLYNVSLEVNSAESPRVGAVVFLLHHTLPRPIRIVAFDGSVAKLNVLTGGSFVCGALIGETRLSLDLAALAGVSQHFRDT